MKFNYTTLETCHTAPGMVLVIDVLRAFSTAAYTFSRGAKEIRLVSTVEEALALKEKIPNSKAMGEVNGIPPEGFDFGNSPTHILGQDLSGLTIIQRTSAGTQGAVRSIHADVMFATSFVVAKATMEAVLEMKPEEITFVVTGGADNAEDLACAQFLEKQFTGQAIDAAEYIQRVVTSKDASFHLVGNHPQFPSSDLDYCTHINAFDFAMPITRENGQPIMRAVKK
jgi:2-phosphosulfolactate phosphatase